MDKHQGKGMKESASARGWSDNSISKRNSWHSFLHSKRKTMGKASLQAYLQLSANKNIILGISEPLLQYIPELF